VYDESVHVPLIVRRPGRRRPQRHDAMVSLVDLAPTIVSLFGFSRDVAGSFPGHDVLSPKAGPVSPRTLFSRSSTEPPSFALRDEEYAFIYRVSPEKAEIYDRRDDPDEVDDLSAARPDLVSRYRADVLARADRLSATVAPPAVEVTPELRGRLEALGYVE
jgi:arylsulfatase A-like enzyme